MIVLDASAAVLALLNSGAARELVATETIAAPHLIDAEVAQVMRAQVLRGTSPPTTPSQVLGKYLEDSGLSAQLRAAREPRSPGLDPRRGS